MCVNHPLHSILIFSKIERIKVTYEMPSLVKTDKWNVIKVSPQDPQRSFHN